MGKKAKYKKKKRNYQIGGLLNGLFGSGFASELITGLGNAVRGFEGEPALKNAFSTSDDLFKDFSSRFDVGENSDNIKSVFDIFSIFSQGIFGKQEGGVVDAGIDAVSRMKQLKNVLKDDIIEGAGATKKAMVKLQFNQKYGDKPESPINIIPGVGNDIRVSYKKGGQMQAGGIPVSPLGQHQYPGQPVAVPTQNGMIDMTGVNQTLLTMDQLGNTAILPPNSGLSQFAPGLVMEFPLDERPRRSKRKKSKLMGSRIPNATVVNYNKRNARTMRRNKSGNVGLPNPR